MANSERFVVEFVTEDGEGNRVAKLSTIIMPLDNLMQRDEFQEYLSGVYDYLTNRGGKETASEFYARNSANCCRRSRR